MTDGNSIPLELVGLAAYALGYAAPLAFFVPLRRSIAAPYFDDWIRAYATLALGAGSGVLTWAGPRWWLLGTVVFTAAGAISLLRLPAHLTGRRPPDAPLLVLGVAACLAGFVSVAMAVDPLQATLPLLLLLAGAYAAVTVSLWRGTEALDGLAARALAAGFALDGLWPVTVLALAPAKLVWLWGLVGGALHAAVGLGLAWLLVARAGALLRDSESGRTRQERFATDVVATVSHELRTPLTILKVSAWMLKDSLNEDGEEARQALAADLVTATDRLSHFLDRLLDLAQHEHGQVAYDMEVASLRELAVEVAAGMRPLFEQANVSLAVEGEAPLTCTLDQERMGQVVTNLLSNALKFTPAGGHVTMEVVAAPGLARLSVRDSGPGLRPEELSLVFQRFYRGAGSRRGLGLGLALSRLIVEDGHRGRLWAESTPGRGATFHVELPAAAPEAS
ncbi:MAG: HAMP domain-containing sensor histidine kinase [Candidatus Sericytochromatia bacterium]|nr:HAMP domain-containing sensor histidine kinase [Candidatus Sericytochromatia bacterium]